MRGEIRDLDPGKDEKPAVVHQPARMLSSLQRGPANVLVSHTEFQGRSAERQGRDRPIPNASQIFQPIPQQPLIAKIVVAAYQIIPQLLQGRLTDHLQHDRGYPVWTAPASGEESM
jgi:hypothetical protein